MVVRIAQKNAQASTNKAPTNATTSHTKIENIDFHVIFEKNKMRQQHKQSANKNANDVQNYVFQRINNATTNTNKAPTNMYI